MKITAKDRQFLEEGIRLFRENQFYECHEAWEAVWKKYQTPERQFIQAMILLAAGMVHNQKGNKYGVIRSWEKALIRINNLKKLFAPTLPPAVLELEEFLNFLIAEVSNRKDIIQPVQQFANRLAPEFFELKNI